MSRNFELLQLAERELELAPESPLRITLDETKPRRRHRGQNLQFGDYLDKDVMARKEAIKLVQRIFLVQADSSPRMVVFAGMDHGNGCSQLCVSTARILAESTSSSVCLVDANLRSPLRRGSGSGDQGLAQALTGSLPVRDLVQTSQVENLWVLPSGASNDARGLLDSGRLKKTFEQLRHEFAYVLIDAPPLNESADAAAFGRLADGLVMVLEANATRREAAARAAGSLQASQVKVLGAVLNKRSFPIPDFLYRRL